MHVTKIAALAIVLASAIVTTPVQAGACSGSQMVCTKGKNPTCTMMGGSSQENSTTEPASNAAYAAAMQRMHNDMDITYTGDADVDFAKGMIPHHQGAIDMAKIVLQHGDDKKIRKLAQNIIKAQEKEIEMMARWLVDETNRVNEAAQKPVKKQAKPAANSKPAQHSGH
jgi:hypothetical protein